MLSNDLTQVILLNPVKINYDLAKWSKEATGGWSANELDGIGMSTGSDVFPANANVWDGVPFSTRREFRSEFLRAIAETYIRFRLLWNKPKKDPVDFFMEVKNNFSELDGVEVDETKILPLLKKLEISRQKYAVSQVVNENKLKKIENILFKAGFKQYQTQESIIKFIKQCKKGLCLTEIEYFDRVIPEDVMKKFDAAEATKQFDNYYILHYDPKKSNNPYYTSDLKPKDPIMFGVIKGSSKLYYIADWIDEFCDLTYKDILTSKDAVDFKLKLVDTED